MNKINLRADHLSLIYGDIEFIYNTDDQWVFTRTWFGEKAIVIFNKGNEQARIPVKGQVKEGNELEIYFTDPTGIEHQGKDFTILLPANSFSIIISKS